MAETGGGQALALIPARGGSKRIPRKNVRPFAGRPMIAWAIAVARDSGLFARIVVSTDDEEIAAVARAEGAEVPFRRPAELATDQAGTVPVVQHALQALGWEGSAPVCCLYPAVPLLRPHDLQAALDLLRQGDCRYVFPLLAFETPVQRALRLTPQGHTEPMWPEHVHSRTQDLPPAYHDAGQFYWGWPAAWRAGEHPHAQARGLVLPPDRAVDIDTPQDWARAEWLHAQAQAARSGGHA